MTLLEETIAAIEPSSKEIDRAIRKRWESLTSYGTFGKFVDMTAQYGAALGTADLPIPKRCMIIAAADHGVAEMGVSAYPVETTQAMTRNYVIPKGAGANALGNYCGASMEVVDIGIAGDLSDVTAVRGHKIAYGTKNFLMEPAMTEDECCLAIEEGIRLVQEKVGEGYRAFLVGEMGISNTTSAAIMTAKFAGLSAHEATGRGTNISDERLLIKQKVVHDALEKYAHIDASDGFHILQCVGGFEFAFITGVILGAAAHHSMTIIDGFNTTACALVAHSLQAHTMDYVMASHLSAEKAHTESLRALGLEAYVDLGLCLGEASGGSIQMEMLDLAVRIYEETK